MVYADSLNAVSAPGFRLSDHPPLVEQLRATMAKLRALPCDILISAHPDHSKLLERLSARESGKADAMFDPEGCRRYVRLEARSQPAQHLLDLDQFVPVALQPYPCRLIA